MKRHLLFLFVFLGLAIGAQFTEELGKFDNFVSGIAIAGAVIALASFARKRRATKIAKTP